jgi:hypothetical protein
LEKRKVLKREGDIKNKFEILSAEKEKRRLFLKV